MKTYAIYIASNEAAPTKSFQIGHSVLKATITLSSVLAVIFVFVLFDYFNLTLKRDHFAEVKSEYNQNLARLQFIESELSTLEEQLKKVNRVTEKIEVIQEYYNRGPTATMSTPTEYFTVDYVAADSSRAPSSVGGPIAVERGLLFKSRDSVLDPIIDEATVVETPVADLMADRITSAIGDTQVLERKVLQLWENLSERQNFIRATPSIRPARGWFSSRFGVRADPFTGRPTMHSGLDIAGRVGTPVVATADGMVTFSGYQNGYGYVIAIDHGYGIQTRYAHNSNLYAKVGQNVRRYDVIAAIGNSGRSTGSHVHYEVRVRGVAVDPINYVLDY